MSECAHARTPHTDTLTQTQSHTQTPHKQAHTLTQTHTHTDTHTGQ